MDLMVRHNPKSLSTQAKTQNSLLVTLSCQFSNIWTREHKSVEMSHTFLQINHFSKLMDGNIAYGLKLVDKLSMVESERSDTRKQL